nr:DUF305 domain-containing protein [Saccharopolyspora hordei]
MAGCTPAEGPSDQPPAPGTPPPATAQQSGQDGVGEHSETDREFAEQLLANRQQVVQLAELAQTNAQNEAVKTLAGELQQAAQLQIGQLNAFLTSVAGQQSGSAPEDATGDAQGVDQPAGPQLDQLRQATGPQFDQQWKQAVRALEDSAGQLARAEQEEGQAPAMRSLAEDFLSAQQDVLTKLNAL